MEGQGEDDLDDLQSLTTKSFLSFGLLGSGYEL